MAQNSINGLNGTNNPNSAASMYSSSNNSASGINGSIMPSAGHYSDMQTLMQNMEVLAGWLKQNREEWGVVQEGLGRVEELRAQGQAQSLPAAALPLEREGDGVGDDGDVQCMRYSLFVLPVSLSLRDDCLFCSREPVIGKLTLHTRA